MFFKLLVFVVVLCAAQASHYRRLVRRSHHEQGITSNVHHESNHQAPQFDLFALSGQMGNWTEETEKTVSNLQNVELREDPDEKCFCISKELENCGKTYEKLMKCGIQAINRHRNSLTDNAVVAQIKADLAIVQQLYNEMFKHVNGKKCADARNAYRKAKEVFGKIIESVKNGLDSNTREGVGNDCGEFYEKLINDWAQLTNKYKTECQ